jgi:hypothetical protein
MKEEKTDQELLLEKIQGLIADSTKEGVTKKELEAKVEEINKELKTLNEKANNHDEVKTLKESVDKLLSATAENAAAIKAMSEMPGNKTESKPMTFKEALIEAWSESAKNVKDLIVEKESNGVKKMSARDYFGKLGNKNTPEMTVKVAVDMLEANIVGNYVEHLRLTNLDPNRVSIPLTIYPHVIDWMPVKPISNKFMTLLVVGTYVDGSGTKTQGSTASLSSFLLTTVSFVSATIGTKFRISDESLDDIPEIMEEIALVGPDKIKDNIDSQILGSAGDDSTTIKGLFAASKKTDFLSSTTYADLIKQANIVDVICTMKLQCEANKYIPDTVVMNPTDVHVLAAAKDQLDNSITDRRVSFSQWGQPIAVDGMIIRKNTSQTVNTAVVLDSRKLQIGDRKQMTLEVGYDADDFTTGHKTVRINVRLAFGVRDAAAVIYCSDLATALSDIEIV